MRKSSLFLLAIFLMVGCGARKKTETVVPVEKAKTVSAAELPAKYVLLHVVNWKEKALENFEAQEASEATYFVLRVSKEGKLTGSSKLHEKRFVARVQEAKKKATFTIGGGTQDKAAITAAVNEKKALCASIAGHIKELEYDGVVLDIENTDIDPQAMADFINELRKSLDSIKEELIIGVDVQTYQFRTVWSKIDQAEKSLTWICPMLYDAGLYNQMKWTGRMQVWETKIPKNKLLYGVAVNYLPENGGLSPRYFGEALDTVVKEKWKGIAIWNNFLYEKPWQDARKKKVSIGN